MKRSVHLAIDLGASNGRVIAGLRSGSTLKLEEIHRFPNAGHAVLGSTYWDVLALFTGIKAGLTQAAKQYGSSVVSLGVDTWGVDFALLDGHGHLLGLPHQYRDPRTQGMEAAACERMSREKIFRTTGVQFMFFNTLLQVLAEVKRGSPALKEARRLLFMPDLFHYWMSGTLANEYTIASTSQMLDARTRKWSRALLKRMGIPTRLFGPLVAPGTDLGPLLPALCEETGLPPARVVAPGSHDTASAVAAVPAQGSDHAYLSSGTWSIMGVESSKPVLNERAMRLGFTNEGGVEGRIRLLKNICGLWLLQECKRVWERKGQCFSYDELVSLAASEPALVSVIDVDHPDFAQSCDMPERIRAYCKRTGQRAPVTPGAVVRTILESLALKYRRVFEWLEELTGRRPSRLHIVGGGSQNDLLNQFAADAIGCEVHAGPVEATALGNVLVQMQSTRCIRTLAEGRTLVRKSFPVRIFKPKSRTAWDAAYERYLRLESR